MVVVGSSGGPSTTSTSADDVLMAQITLRLDEKWEKFIANFSLQCLDLAKQVVLSFQVVAYATAACLLLYGTSCVLRVLLLPAHHKSRTTTTRQNDNDDKTRQDK